MPQLRAVEWPGPVDEFASECGQRAEIFRNTHRRLGRQEFYVALDQAVGPYLRVHHFETVAALGNDAEHAVVVLVPILDPGHRADINRVRRCPDLITIFDKAHAEGAFPT